MTSEAVARVDTGAGGRGSRGGGRGSRGGGEAAAAPREPAPQEATASGEAASQAALDALLRELLPRQRDWSDEDYLWLTDRGNRRVELTDGRIEGLPIPTDAHQSVLLFLHALFRVWLRPRGGVVMVSGMRMRVRESKFREPDILLLRDRSDPRRRNRCWQGADLVVEVVSPDDPDRDLVEKRADYAEAGIPEYWIADPRDETLTVLVLHGEAYVEHGRYGRGRPPLRCCSKASRRRRRQCSTPRRRAPEPRAPGRGAPAGNRVAASEGDGLRVGSLPSAVRWTRLQPVTIDLERSNALYSDYR